MRCIWYFVTLNSLSCTCWDHFFCSVNEMALYLTEIVRLDNFGKPKLCWFKIFLNLLFWVNSKWRIWDFGKSVWIFDIMCACPLSSMFMSFSVLIDLPLGQTLFPLVRAEQKGFLYCSSSVIPWLLDGCNLDLLG